jgi:hypothetical protein
MPPAYGQTTSGDLPALQIRIRDVERLLQNLEALMPADTRANAASQTAMVRGLLQGTDWIDPSRSVVADLQYDGQAASWLVLVPFQRSNESFQRSYGAVAGDDYYLLRFPSAPDATLPDQHRDRLLQASREPAETQTVVELAARRLLHQTEPQITAALQAMASNAAAEDVRSPLAPGAIQQMTRDLFDTGKQVETLRLGLDLDPETLLLLLDVKAVPNSFLAGLLVDREADMRLGGYQVDAPIRFRSRSYNVAGTIQMLGASFGQFYRQMGFDFDELAGLAKGLTGEMVGGMALDNGGLNFKMIYALHDLQDGEAYLTDVYLPWFQKYNRQMASLMEAQAGQAATPLYERLPDTRIAGKRVLGLRTRFPAATPPGNAVAPHVAFQDYETRLTAVDNLILMASSETAIEDMISTVGTLQRTPARGPLVEFALDWGGYLKGLQGMMPANLQALAIPDDMGELTVVADMQAGQLTTRTRMKVADLQRTMGLLADASTRMAAAGTTAAAESASAGMPGRAPSEDAATSPLPERPETADDWMDRGGLLSAYGNYRAAEQCYRKALALDPDLAEAYFQLGVAYGELGQFEAALEAVSQAIDRRPANGAYFYGRGRIYLLAGENDLAMKDFMEAGFLGNEDARVYLEEAGVDLP